VLTASKTRSAHLIDREEGAMTHRRQVQRLTKPASRTRLTTAQRKARFLIAFVPRFGNIYETCQDVGIARSTLYEWRASDPDFETAMQDARENADDVLRGLVLRRARKNDQLLWQIARRRLPEYRDPVKPPVVKNATVTTNITATLSRVDHLNEEQREKLIAMFHECRIELPATDALAHPAPEAIDAETVPAGAVDVDAQASVADKKKSGW
jgi:hypothetical protein